MDQLIEQWFAKHFHGLGQKLDTDLYNILHAAKEDLKRILHAEPEVPEPQSPSPDLSPATEEY